MPQSKSSKKRLKMPAARLDYRPHFRPIKDYLRVSLQASRQRLAWFGVRKQAGRLRLQALLSDSLVGAGRPDADTSHVGFDYLRPDCGKRS
jgi:hypothetical protein